MATNFDRASDRPLDPTGRVAGAVLDGQGRGRGGVDLFLERVGPGGTAAVLGKSVSGQRGAYRIEYDRAAALGKTGGGLSLRVRAGRDEKSANRSPVLRNAPASVEGFDLVVEGNALDRSSDFERISDDLSGAAKRAGIDLAELRETPAQPDASLLAAETGYPVAKVVLLATALRMARDSKGQIGAALAYGLGSQGVPFGTAALAGALAQALAAHLDTAIERGIVPDAARAQLRPALDAVAGRLRELGIEAAANGPLGRIFVEAAGAERAQRYIAIVAEHRGDATQLWAKVAHDPQIGSAANDLRFAAESAVLVGAKPEAVAMLRELKAAGEIRDHASLVAWTAVDWADRLTQAGVDAPGLPDDADATARDAARRSYALGLDRVVEALYPRLYAERRIAESTLPGHAAIAAFLAQAEGFSLSGDSPSAYLRGRDGLAAMLAADPEAMPTLAALARTTRVTRRVAPAIALVADGMGSAAAVTAAGPRYFARRYAGSFGSTGLALEAHARASFITVAGAELLIQAAPGHGLLTVMPPPGVTELPAFPNWATLFGADDGCACSQCNSVTGPGAYLVDVLQFLRNRPGPAQAGAPNALDVLRRPGRRPDLTEIELSCENADTRLPYIDLVNEVLEDSVAPLPPFASVALAGPVTTGPGRPIISAALRGQMNAALGLVGGRAAFAISADAGLYSLTEGRPWTGAAPSWRVEDRLATYTIVTTVAGLEIASRGRNTRGPVAERLLSPQYVNALAYTRLAGAYYPWTLPFDRPLAEARAGLSALDERLAAVLEIFAPGTAEERRRRTDVANERLGLSETDALLVAWTQPQGGPALRLGDAWWHWGFNAANASAANPVPDPADITTPIVAGNWVAILAGRLDVLLDRGQLSIEEVLALLDTNYVNPPALAGGARRTIELVSTDAADPATCRARALALRGLDQAALIRIARLVRLSRRSGLSFREIDQALLALGAAAPDRDFLNALAQLVALRDRLGADWQRLVGCFVPPGDARLLRIWAPTGAERSLDRDGAETRLVPTLYERLFRPALNPTAGLQWFPPDPGGLAGQDLRDGLVDLAAAFGISAPDMVMLMASDLVLIAGAGGIDTGASLSNLARLHRHALLMAGLGLGAADYLAALRLFDFDRTTFDSPARLADFMAILDRVLDGPLSIAELNRLTRQQGDADEVLRLRADIETLDTLRANLKAVGADSIFVPLGADGEAPTTDRDGALTRRKLIAVGHPAALADAAVAALSGTAVHETSDPALPVPDATALEVPPCEAVLGGVPAGVDVAVLSGGRLTFDNANAVLRATAVLGDADRQSLVDASSDQDYRAALANLFDLQDLLKGRATFDPDGGTLRFRGPMPNHWRSHLDSLSAQPAWRAAVARLNDAPRAVAHRVLRAWRHRSLATPLPNGLPIRLAPGLQGRLYLDTSVAPPQLRLTGPLLDSELAALRAAAPSANPDHVAFRDALDRLMLASDAAQISPADRLVADADLNALLDEPLAADERYRRLLSIILPRAAQVLGDIALIQSLAAVLGLSAGTAERLAQVEIQEPAGGRTAAEVLRDSTFVDSPTALLPNPQAFPAQHRMLRLLQQAAVVAARFRLTAPDFLHLASIPGWPRLADLPAQAVADDVAAPVSATALLRFADYAALRDRIPGGRETLIEIAGTPDADRIALLARRLSRPEAELTLLAGATLLDLDAAALASESGLLRLHTALARLDRVRLSAAAVEALRIAPLSIDAGRAVIATVGAGMNGAQWQEAGRALFDRIRVASRDALLAYILARGRPAEFGTPAMRWRTPGELLGHFLIDVEMGPCMETSRLRQAMSSVQLYVQRCQLGLEAEVVADADLDDGWLQWEWMRSYRVWEANRKVYLWPENLLDPEFMDVKSQPFRELQGDLGQGEVTLEGAARAMLVYLEKLKRIARLRPIAIAREPVGDKEVLHVIAATQGEPVEFHYRSRDDLRIWSPWEKADLEIKSEHVLLHVWNGRPFLFWLDFMPRGEKGAQLGPPPAPTNADTAGIHLVTSLTQVFDVRLCWSELRDGQWSPQRQSREMFVIEEDSAGPDTRWAAFRVEQGNDDVLWIQWGRIGPGALGSRSRSDRKAFRIDYPHAEPVVEQWASIVLPDLVPTAMHWPSGQAILGGTGPLALPHDNGALEPALRQITPLVELVYPLTSPDGTVWEGPFLIRDRLRAFAVTSSTLDIGSHTTLPDSIPGDFDAWFDPAWRHALPEERPPRVPPGPEPEQGPVINPIEEYAEATRAGRDPRVGRPPDAEAADRNIGAMGEVFAAEARAAADSAATAMAMVVSHNEGAGGLLATLGLGGPAELGSGTTVQPLMLRSAGMDSPRIAYGADGVARTMLSEQRQNAHYSVRYERNDYALYLHGQHTLRRYRFEPLYHPYADALIDVLRRDGLKDMLSRKVQLRPFEFLPRPTTEALDFAATYGSVPTVVEWQGPRETLDFGYDGAYSVYNWELFFHVPMLIADRLAGSQRFDEALRWLHMVFDPRDQSRSVTAEDGTQINLGAARYWQCRPLFENSLPRTGLPAADDTVVERERIERILTVLAAAAAPDANNRLTAADREDLQAFTYQVEQMRRKPFRPHAIARVRTSAYQRAVVMKYLDILISWGDQLFRRDTMESINAATQLYVLAAELRGREGAVMPARAVSAPQTYASLQGRLDTGSNALVEIEAFVAPSAAPYARPAPGLPPPAMLAFCVPRNDKLAGYWATIADRLFKIRHCLNIEGVARQLALFEPPIDPALLARAVAAGVDIGAALADLDGPTPGRRFRVVVRQAAELAGEVRSLGATLLAACEKRDGEMLARLRATHERAIVERAEIIRELQVEEAEASLVALRASRDSASERFRHYRRLLGETNSTDPAEGAKIPMRSPRADTATQSVDVFKLVAPLLSEIPFADAPPGTDTGGLPANTYEAFELAMLELSQGYQLASSAFDVLSGVVNILPNFNVQPFGVGVTFGGSNLGAAFSALGAAGRGLSSAVGFAASMAGRAAQYASRADEWIFQQNLAAREVMQIDRQILAADLRRQLAEKELENHKLQLEDLAAQEEAMQGKFTNQELYDWMASRLADLHFQMYQLAYDWAKRAQRAARIELQRPQIDFIRFGQWDGRRKGLVAGEALSLDIHRLELAYDELDIREESMQKHVSLARADPAALVRLRETGVATFTVPEVLFDLDCPGQYLRRLKSVAVTIPCVTGPYTTVHARVTLLRSTIRASSALAGRGRAYARESSRDDPRFTDLMGQPQSIVTSSAQNDSGLFETSLEDPRYLPFEGLGVIGEWRIELPSTFRAFDYDSISDVVLHLRYTARNGGDPLRAAVQADLTTALNALESASAGGGLMRRISLRHEAPGAWRRMLEAPEGGFNVIDLPIERARLPFFLEGRRIHVQRILVLAKLAPDFMADYRGALGGDLAALGEAAPNPLAFTPWLGTFLRASWEGNIDLDRPGVAGAPPSPWRLRLQGTAVPAAPVVTAALEDVEVLVGYTLG